jgi:hypothetical protein
MMPMVAMTTTPPTAMPTMVPVPSLVDEEEALGDGDGVGIVEELWVALAGLDWALAVLDWALAVLDWMLAGLGWALAVPEAREEEELLLAEARPVGSATFISAPRISTLIFLSETQEKR